ncbi:lysylphosphatidylglycerol synthase domain-containing protein [Pigmentiphaga litoralis]|uniref:Uncharacterized protein n=1 Tax=Pigmentiphaga litoralis TaxID=516702 RepID=A0A7Y9LPM3_9BURK|nr:lysylphosphatidylglycerol synthase domain-containing protein [Pigmentiphaga litoralis]NYE21712.1 hypothetical protein [Pigmentiphaga litoralis]NYE84673.1 hypothetical protein [Pigmentiphaga litoralis]
MTEAVHPQTGQGAKKAWWPWAKRILTGVFFILVIWLLVTQARAVEWGEVRESITAYKTSTLALAVLLAAASHLLFSSFDLLGRIYTQHGLSKLKVLLVASISYVFTLNLGALVGGVGFRYRLYTRLGLDKGVITRVYALSVITNWLGYFVLGGAAFLFAPIDVPDGWKVGSTALQVLGAALLAIAAVYFCLCAFAKKRTYTIRKQELTLPSFRLAATQCVISVVNWSVMASIIYLLLQQKIEFTAVLTVLLMSAVAGVLTHVPAGLGVLEAVFIAMLGDRMPASALLAALLAYRAIYYLIPLVIGTVAYAVTEARAKKMKQAG